MHSRYQRMQVYLDRDRDRDRDREHAYITPKSNSKNMAPLIRNLMLQRCSACQLQGITRRQHCKINTP
jgi:hypothetical protein